MKPFTRLSTLTAAFVIIAFVFIAAMQYAVADASPSLSPQAESCLDFSVRSKQIFDTAMVSVTNDEFRDFDAESFVARELILGGSIDDIGTISNTLAADLGIGLVSASRPFSVSGQLIQLFEVRQGGEAAFHTVRQLLCEIDRLKASSTISDATIAEPNYLVSPAPWWAGGSQWRDDAPGFGYVLTNEDDESVALSAFKEQWIWGNQGISLTVDSTFGPRRTISQTGAGVKVAIFDTSPIADTGNFSFTLADGGVPLVLNIATGAFSTTVEGNPTNALIDHGIFVASLIHEVAPAARIDLIPTLDFSRTVDLFTVSRVVNDYVTTEFSRTNSLAGTVLNLSLGVHHPISSTFPGVTETFGFPSEVLTLKAVLQEAHNAGAVIVAAAGNDFAFGDEGSSFMEAPASYDFVIGVGGSTNASGSTNPSGAAGRSCFSNNGDVFAPGGDGESNCGFPPNAAKCQTDPTLCVIGLAHTQVFSDSNAGFRGWVGSSFAAPQVAGLAALILGEAFSSTQTLAQLPAQVRSVIECGAGQGDVNVISVAGSFSEACIEMILESKGEVRFKEQAISVDEDAGAVDIVLERINGSRGTINISVGTIDDLSSGSPATPGQDYTVFGGNAIFSDGVTEVTISIPILDNNTAEEDETFKVQLLAEDLTTTEAVVTIVDNDTTPAGVLQFSSAAYSVNEDAEAVTITVLRTGGTVDEVMVSYATMDGTATFARDFDNNLGALTFAPGESEQSFTVKILDDRGDEPNETFTVRLSDVVGVAALGDPSEATVTILDDDGAPNPTATPQPTPTSEPTPTPTSTPTPNPTEENEAIYVPLLQN